MPSMMSLGWTMDDVPPAGHHGCTLAGKKEKASRWGVRWRSTSTYHSFVSRGLLLKCSTGLQYESFIDN